MDQETKPQTPAGENLPTAVPLQTLATTFTKVDNNLTGIGFFTASSKRSRKAIEKSTVTIDQGIEHRISILPSAKYGLPITQDQDYWLALMKLVSEHLQAKGKLSNPFTFTAAELHHVLGQCNSGNNYQAVNEWLNVMAFTGIEGGAYNTARKTWYAEKTHALDRVITAGKELPGGVITDRNQVWFSQWQLDDINAGHLIPIEFDTYIRLKNNIAKNLVPYLQEWLFASQRDGRFEKRYEDICQLLGIRVYRYGSQMKEQLSPSLDELLAFGYLSKWTLEPMADGKSFKLVLWHGSKYHADRRTRLKSKNRHDLPPGESTEPATRRPRQQRIKLTGSVEPKPETSPTAEPSVIIDPTLVAEFEKRGVAGVDARKHIAAAEPGQPILDQLEYGDLLIARKRGNIDNPPGFYISLIQRNVPVPPSFISSRRAKELQEANERKQQAILERQIAEMQAGEEERSRLNAEIQALAPEERQELASQAKKELLKAHPHMAHYLKTHPEDINDEDGTVHGMMRRLLQEGWAKPHQATDPAPPKPAEAAGPTVKASVACPNCGGQIVLYSDGTGQECGCRQQRKLATQNAAG